MSLPVSVPFPPATRTPFGRSANASEVLLLCDDLYSGFLRPREPASLQTAVLIRSMASSGVLMR